MKRYTHQLEKQLFGVPIGYFQPPDTRSQDIWKFPSRSDDELKIRMGEAKTKTKAREAQKVQEAEEIQHPPEGQADLQNHH